LSPLGELWDIILIPFLRDLRLIERRLFAVFNPLFERHRELQRRRADEGFDGFTLIELLIVIVVLAILAATVIFALGGVTGNSSKAACNSDAKSVEVAVEAFKASPNNTALSGQYPDLGAAGQAELTDGSASNYGGPYLHSWPSNPGHYTITLDATVPGQVDVNGTAYDTAGCAAAK
jgi:general secretion pathway protein G